MTDPTTPPAPGTAVSRVEASADPYDHQDPRNRIAVQVGDPVKQVEFERALAMASPLGKLLLTGQSEFLMICRASGVPAERMVMELIACARKKPAIMQCTHESIMTFMFDAVKLGLPIGRGVFPVPIGRGKGRDRVQVLEAWVGYKGNKQLAIESGLIRDCWAQVVYEGDEFKFAHIPVPNVLAHIEGPHFGDMAFAREVYAIALYGNGQTRALKLSKQDVMKRRALNKSANNDDSPWQTNPRDMWQAKAIQALTADMPQGGLSPRLAHLRAMIERNEAQAALPLPTAPGIPVPALAQAETPEPTESETPSEPMSLGEASSIPIMMKGGTVRLVSEIRNVGLEHVRTQARARLEETPDDLALQRIAEACTVVLDARAAGTAKEPVKREGN